MKEHLYLRTPLIHSSAKTHLYYKEDCLQPTRSFKIRGMENLVRHWIERRKTRFVASSGGNAGYSLSYVCNRLGAKVKVFVPVTTSPKMIELMENENAEVIIQGDAWDDADQLARAEVDESGAVYVSPFDDPLLWEGHSSIIDESAEEMEEPDAVVVAVGGGGLLCGIMEGLARNRWNKTKVFSAETEGAASYARSVAAGHRVTLEKIDTVATSLGARTVSEKAFEWIKSRRIETFVCSDRDAVRACLDFLAETGFAVEPACGAALAAAQSCVDRDGMKKILVIVCGGAAADRQVLDNYLQQFA